MLNRLSLLPFPGVIKAHHCLVTSQISNTGSVGGIEILLSGLNS